MLPHLVSHGPKQREGSSHLRGLFTPEGQFDQLYAVIDEYRQQNHAELVHTSDLKKPVSEAIYLSMHVVHKKSSSTN